MRTVVETFNIYEFNELNEKAKECAIQGVIDRLIHLAGIMETYYGGLDKRTNLYKAIKKANDNGTPWFQGQYILEMCKKQVFDEAKKALYKEDGTFYAWKGYTNDKVSKED